MMFSKLLYFKFPYIKHYTLSCIRSFSYMLPFLPVPSPLSPNIFPVRHCTLSSVRSVAYIFLFLPFLSPLSCTYQFILFLYTISLPLLYHIHDFICAFKIYQQHIRENMQYFSICLLILAEFLYHGYLQLKPFTYKNTSSVFCVRKTPLSRCGLTSFPVPLCSQVGFFTCYCEQ